MDPVTARDMSRMIGRMFNRMDAWRHLPKYKLEGRLAPFFELYLHDVLSECLGVELHPVVIPEFPLRKGALHEDEKSNLSNNVDYVAFSMDRKTAFLVELKTDMGSIHENQVEYLRLALAKGLKPLVGGVIEICGSKGCEVPEKYVHLLHLLAKLELVTIPDPGKLYQLTFPTRERGWTKAFAGVKPTVEGKLKHTRVIFIQPTEDKPGSSVTGSDRDFRHIYFRDVAEIVQRFGDLGGVFAHYLRRWSEAPGQRYPRTVAQRP